MRSAGILCVAIALCLSAELASAQVPPAGRPYDGIQAGLDAFRLAEEQRQAAVVNQLNTNEAMRAWSGLPSARGSTILYGYPVAAPLADLDFAYAYGTPRSWGGLRGGLGAARWTVFEPWPFIPGDVYGYRYVAPLRQPIGQWQGQTGPRRWESHPVYEPPLPDYRPLPEVESPLLDATPYAAPPVVAPPASAPPSSVPRRGPREY